MWMVNGGDGPHLAHHQAHDLEWFRFRRGGGAGLAAQHPRAGCPFQLKLHQHPGRHGPPYACTVMTGRPSRPWRRRAGIGEDRMVEMMRNKAGASAGDDAPHSADESPVAFRRRCRHPAPCALRLQSGWSAISGRRLPRPQWPHRHAGCPCPCLARYGIQTCPPPLPPPTQVQPPGELPFSCSSLFHVG